MHGAGYAAPVGRCHPHQHRRHEFGAALFPELWAMTGRGPRGFGPGPHGPGPRGRRGGRARRGDVRAAALVLLAEEPRNGYQLMQEIEERSGGVWRPSPGSVYPALQQLEDEGLVRNVEHDGGRRFELTDAGRAHVEEHRDRLGVPWEQVAEGVPPELHELRTAGRALGVASLQVAQTGTKAQLAAARQVLEDARRALYRILAGDDPNDEGTV